MKVCPYARQECRWPAKGCIRKEELLPVFASSPESAVRRVWSCEWAGSRLTVATYLMYLIDKGDLITHAKAKAPGKTRTPAPPEEDVHGCL